MTTKEQPQITKRAYNRLEMKSLRDRQRLLFIKKIVAKLTKILCQIK